MNASTLAPAAAQVAPLLARLPVNLFASVMGIAGLAIAWQRAAHLWSLPAAIGHALGALAALVYVLLAAVFFTKALRHRAALIGEWQHPVRSAMVPTASIGLLLLAIVAINAGLRVVGEVVWLVGTLAHLLLTLAIVGRWLRHNTHEPAHANPAWFIPAVGNVLVPLAGVRLGYTEISWLFFGIGMGFWLVLLPIVFARLVFGAELPARMRPLLFILIPPPAIGFLSYVALVGQVDAIAHVLYGFAAFLTLLLLAQGRWFSALPFFVSWWGYTFPLAAITVATLAMAQASGAAGYRWSGAALLVLVTVVVTLVSVRTIAAFVRRDPHFME